MALSVLSFCASLKRVAQAANTFNPGVLKSHNNHITMQIALPTSQDTVRPKRHTHRRRYNWRKALISQFIGDNLPMTISHQSCF